MKDTKRSIQDCEIMAGIQYTLYESYAILVLEQLKKSKDPQKLNEILGEVKKMQQSAFNEWLNIQTTLSEMVKKEYHMDLLRFQLSECSFAGTKHYKELMQGFRDSVYAVQQMIARNESKCLGEKIDALSQYLPCGKGNDYVLKLFISKTKGTTL